MRIIFIFLLAFFLPEFSNATTRIDITGGNFNPLPIAINDFGGSWENSHNLGLKITNVIANDLSRSGLFEIIDSGAFLEKINSVGQIPVFNNWRQINASSLLVGSIGLNFNNQIQVEYRLWNPYTEKQIKGMSYSASEDQWRKIAHRISDDIYKVLTGDDGYFNTRIAYVSETGHWKKRVKRLALIDQDGENLTYLTNGKNIVMSPRFSPDGQKLLYMSFAGRSPKVHFLDLNTGREKVLGHFPGMSFAPRFSPDGKSAAMSVATDGKSEIYEINLITLQQTKLTHGYDIDTSPTYSPDGKYITFSSDRGGKNQIYVMERSGSNQKRISFGNGSYTTPAWSPRGDYIAFTKLLDGIFYIGVMRPDGSGERILTQGYLVEGPSWAPNGRVIMFAKGERSTKNKLGRSSIVMIDLTGFFERELILPTDASGPCWSNTLN